MRLSIFSLGLVACLMAVQSASAAITYKTYSFRDVNSDSPTATSIGESQLFLNVVDIGGNNVRFEFRNIGANPASITEIHFDANGPSFFDGTLPAMSSVVGSSGVAFSPIGVTPSQLNGADIPIDDVTLTNKDYNFVSKIGWKADSDEPVVQNGVNPYEWLIIDFQLQPTQTYASVIAALDLALGSADVDGDNVTDVPDGLRVGVYVQDVPNGGQTFINGGALPEGTGPAPLPEPATLAIWGMGLGIAGLVRLRRRK